MVMKYADIALKLESIIPADYPHDLCPVERYAIINNRRKVGRIDFRLGQSKHLLMYAGQIGYGVGASHRGHGFAAKALLALKDHCLRYYPEVYITCKVDNIASRKTLERAGAALLGEVILPKNNRMRSRGYTSVLRFALQSDQTQQD